MIEWIPTLSGWLGALVLLAGYFLNIFKFWPSGSRKYLWANLLGSAGLLVNALSTQAWPFVVINTLWLVVSVVAVVRKR